MMASLSSKKLKSSSCTSLQQSGEIAISEPKEVKRGKNRKKFRSTLGLNNFLETADDTVFESPKPKSSKTTSKRSKWLDILPSLEGNSSQPSRSCASESDPQDAETSTRKLRRGRSKRTTRNLAKSQTIQSVSEESNAELDKENAEKARQSKKKRKSVKQIVTETALDVPKLNEDEAETEEMRPIENPIISNLIKTSALKSSPKPKRSVVDSPMPNARATLKLSHTPALMKVNEDQSVDSLRKNSVLKRNRSVASPMPKIRAEAKWSSTPAIEKINEDEVFVEEEKRSVTPSKRAVVNSLRKNSLLKNTPKRTASIVGSSMNRGRESFKNPIDETTARIQNLPDEEENRSTVAVKNPVVDNLRKNSVLKSSQKPKRSVSVVDSTKRKTSAKLSSIPTPRNARKQSTPLKNQSKRVTDSENESTEPTKNSTFDIGVPFIPLDDEGFPIIDDDFCFDFQEIGDKKPARRPSSETSKTSLASERDASVIEIFDSSVSSSDKNATFEKYSLSDDVFPNTTPLSLSDEVLYDSTSRPSSSKELIVKSELEVTWSSPKKLRGTFEKQEMNGEDEILGQSTEKKLRDTFNKSEMDSIHLASSSKKSKRDTFDKTSLSAKKKQRTFDKSEINEPDEKTRRGTNSLRSEAKEIANPSPKKKLRSTFDKSEIVSSQLKSDTFDRSNSEPRAIAKKKLRSTFDNNEIAQPGTSLLDTLDCSNSEPQAIAKTKLRSTFDKNEIAQAGTSLLDDEVFNFAITGPSPTRSPKRRTFSKSPTNNSIPLVEGPSKIYLASNSRSRKSSGFGRLQTEDILEHLNITRRDSRKSSFKKRSSSFKYSTGSEDDIPKRTRYVTLRRGNATSQLNQSTPLFGTQTWEAGVEKNGNVTAKSPPSAKKSILKKSANALDKSSKSAAGKDVFQAVFDLPPERLGNLMLDDEKPDLLVDTLASLKPQLSPEPRRSSRRRWSQSERTPIFDQLLPQNSSRTINKSVRFEKGQKELVTNKKKSVKINSPQTTPKGKFQHAPMVLRKTPKSKSIDTSIISGNCALDSTPMAYMSPPASSSTPRHQNRSLLKKVLTNEKSKAEKMLKNTSSRVKMPDFAKIHERRYEKLENIQDLVERKAQRALYLMSGGKSLVAAKEKTEKESRKKLFGDEDKKPNAQASKLPVLKFTKMKQKIIAKKRVSLEKKQKELKKTATKSAENPKNTALLNKRVSMEKNKAAVPSGRVISRFGFKMPTEQVNATKEEQIKAVCAKSKFIVNTSRTDQNRKNTAQVRSNRRFDLLMQMRANKK